MSKRKRENAEDFIGWKSEDGLLEVVGLYGRDKANRALYKVTCKICSPDTELFPEGYFIIRQDHFKNGIKPCGCSKRPNWSEQKYLIKARRLAKEKNIIVHGYAEEFHGQNTRLNCECKIDKYKWTTMLKHIINTKVGCPKCNKNAKITEQEALKKCEQICKEFGYEVIGFIDGYKNTRSSFYYNCSKHGKQVATHDNFVMQGTRCPQCAETGYNPDKPGSFYIVKWTKDDHSFIKFGITNQKLVSRIKQQARLTNYKYNIIFSRMWIDGHIPLGIEKSIKRLDVFERGVINKSLFLDGFTETVDIKTLDILMKFVMFFIALYVKKSLDDNDKP